MSPQQCDVARWQISDVCTSRCSWALKRWGPPCSFVRSPGLSASCSWLSQSLMAPNTTAGHQTPRPVCDQYFSYQNSNGLCRASVRHTFVSWCFGTLAVSGSVSPYTAPHSGRGAGIGQFWECTGGARPWQGRGTGNNFTKLRQSSPDQPASLATPIMKSQARATVEIKDQQALQRNKRLFKQGWWCPGLILQHSSTIERIKDGTRKMWIGGRRAAAGCRPARGWSWLTPADDNILSRHRQRQEWHECDAELGFMAGIKAASAERKGRP